MAFRVVLSALVLWAAMGLTALAQDSHDEGDHTAYPEGVDASAMIDNALALARAENKTALFIFGANWCHDSRGLAAHLQDDPDLAALVNAHYVVTRIDVGVRHRNIDQLNRFGVSEAYGTPTLVITNGDGEPLNGATAHDWRTAHDAAGPDVAAFLRRYAGLPAAEGEMAGVDFDRAARAWPPYQSAASRVSAMLEEGALTEAQSERARGYIMGMARSMARLAMGRYATAEGLSIADQADLDALGVESSADLTDVIVARMADINFDLLARLQNQIDETARHAREEASEG